jgi:Fe2+ or Zn2+ uptake regulation protein
MRHKTEAKSYDQTISEKGFRFTEQRRHVYDALMARRDHPTAVEVFMRVKPQMPSISLATVYNCLETLTECGLVKHVHHHREPSRYCPNLADHAHLFCEQCGSVTDLPLRIKRQTKEIWDLPADVVIAQHEVSFRGLCPKCAAGAHRKAAAVTAVLKRRPRSSLRNS